MASYQPQVFIRTADVSTSLQWPEGTADAEDKMVSFKPQPFPTTLTLLLLQVMPGDNVEMVCEINKPLALEQGQRFNIREGGRTVATGLITRLMG